MKVTSSLVHKNTEKDFARRKELGKEKELKLSFLPSTGPVTNLILIFI